MQKGGDGVWGFNHERCISGMCSPLRTISVVSISRMSSQHFYALLLHLSNMAHIDFSPYSLLTAQSETPKTLKSRSSFDSLSKQAVEKGKEGASTYTKR